MGDNFEIIFVDEGSVGCTLQKLKECHRKERRIKIVVLSRNFGHQAAHTAGLSSTTGDYIAMMDGDLQDPPELLKSMYDKLLNEEYVVHKKLIISLAIRRGIKKVVLKQR